MLPRRQAGGGRQRQQRQQGRLAHLGQCGLQAQTVLLHLQVAVEWQKLGPQHSKLIAFAGEVKRMR